jgi:aspartyl protease family protein
MVGSRLLASALVVAAGLGSVNPPVARAQGQEALIPYAGETAAEFEARQKGLPRPVRADPSKVTLVADSRGHFGVEPTINGTRVRMMVDTGATTVTLTEKDARAVGINPPSRDFSMKMSTPNGVVLVAPALLPEIAIGDIVVRDVRAVVVPEDKLQVSLLGMSFLSRLSHFEVTGDRLVLTR